MRPNKIDVFEDNVYVTILRKKYIVRIDKFGFKNMSQLDIGFAKIADLAVYQQQKQFHIGELHFFFFLLLSASFFYVKLNVVTFL